MSFCGYNKTMSNAMTMLAVGIAMQCDKRAAREKKTTAQVVAIELEELDITARRLSASPKCPQFASLIGFVMLVRDLFAHVQKAVEADPSVSAASAFEQVIEPFNNLMFELDAHYFDQSPEAGIEAKMAALVALAEARV